MRKIARKLPNNSSGGRFTKQRSEYTFSMLTSIIMAIVGFICSTPFIWYAFIKETGHPTTGSWLSFMLFLVAAPMMVMGIIGIFVRRSYGSSVDGMALDVARIRFATEMHLMRDVMKDFKGNKND